jgi:hypothetical protein
MQGTLVLSFLLSKQKEGLCHACETDRIAGVGTLPGAPHSPAIIWRYTTGAASGTVPFAIPASVAPGNYELRLFANDGYTLLASTPIVITAAVVSLSASPTSVSPGGTLSATWGGILAPSATDWVGLFVPGAANSAFLAWRYTTGAASGTVPFTLPANLAQGNYELRLFSNNTSTLLATSNGFTVSRNSGADHKYC